MDTGEHVLARRLRWLAVGSALLGLAIAIIAFFPGEHLSIADSSECTHWDLHLVEHPDSDRSNRCIPRDEVVDAGGVVFALLVVVLLAPAVAVYRRPTRARATKWLRWIPIAGVVTFGFLVAADFRAPEHVVHSEQFWPLWAVEIGFTVLWAIVLGCLLALLRPSRAEIAGRG
jgi:hypothetical protein